MRSERFESALWQTSSLLLLEGDEAVLVDPAIDEAEVDAIAARADALGARVSAILVTHADWDHVCGLARFPQAQVLMGEGTAARVASGAPLARMGEAAAEYGLRLAGPPRVDRVLPAGEAWRAGPVTVETIALPGHQPDSTGFRVRETGLLAVGDHLSTIEFPFVSSTAAYRSTLAALIDLLRRDPPQQVVPGHGPPLTAAEALAVAEQDLDFLHRLRAAVAGALAAGGDVAAARGAGLAVEPPRSGPEDLSAEAAANVEAQLAELHAA